MLSLEQIKNSKLLGQIDLVTLEWLYRFKSANCDEQHLLSLLTLFFFHQSESQIGLPMDEQNLQFWLQKLQSQDKGRLLKLSTSQQLAQNPIRLFPEIIGAQDSAKPLVFADQRLYVQRLYQAENDIMEILPLLLQGQLNDAPPNYDQLLAEVLDVPRTAHSRQAAAVALAPLSRFFVLSGGPGTGKTTVLVHILRTWLRLDRGRKPADILLCAPTGKAKARMLESLSGELADLCKDLGSKASALDLDLLDNLPQSSTLHQVLWKALQLPLGAPIPKLKQKLIVIDEVSMVDLSLFRLLLQSIAEDTQVILLGDMNQLPSVEHGAVLGDLTEPFAASRTSLSADTAQKVKKWLGQTTMTEPEQLDQLVHAQTSMLRDKVIQLSKSHRSETHILDLANLILGFGSDSHWEVAKHDRLHIDVLEHEKGFEPYLNRWFEQELTPIARRFNALDSKGSTIKEILLDPDFGLAFRQLAKTRILGMQKSGSGGVEQANQLGHAWLIAQNAKRTKSQWLHGQPIMLTTNLHSLDLYNGDCGVIVRVKANTYAVFEQKGKYQAYMAEELQGLSSAFALTIHKSQGSEYEHPLILIPFGESTLATKEILYTGVTRAKSELSLVGNCAPVSLASIAANKIERPSRLRNFLRSSS